MAISKTNKTIKKIQNVSKNNDKQNKAKQYDFLNIKSIFQSRLYLSIIVSLFLYHIRIVYPILLSLIWCVLHCALIILSIIIRIFQQTTILR